MSAFAVFKRWPIATGLFVLHAAFVLLIRPGQPLLTVAHAAQRLETWTILDMVRQALGIVAISLALKAYGAACRLQARQTTG